MRAAEDVAAHAPLLCGGEERPRAGGGAGEEGLAVQATGEKQLLLDKCDVSEQQHIDPASHTYTHNAIKAFTCNEENIGRADPAEGMCSWLVLPQTGF